jgi:hypothetical protein
MVSVQELIRLETLDFPAAVMLLYEDKSITIRTEHKIDGLIQGFGLNILLQDT